MGTLAVTQYLAYVSQHLLSISDYTELMGQSTFYISRYGLNRMLVWRCLRHSASQNNAIHFEGNNECSTLEHCPLSIPSMRIIGTKERKSPRSLSGILIFLCHIIKGSMNLQLNSPAAVTKLIDRCPWLTLHRTCQHTRPPPATINYRSLVISALTCQFIRHQSSEAL